MNGLTAGNNTSTTAKSRKDTLLADFLTQEEAATELKVCERTFFDAAPVTAIRVDDRGGRVR